MGMTISVGNDQDILLLTRDGQFRREYNLSKSTIREWKNTTVMWDAETIEEAVQKYNWWREYDLITVEWVKEQMTLCILAS